jgi:hypothetical protein
MFTTQTTYPYQHIPVSGFITLKSLQKQAPSSAIVPLSKMVDGFSPLFIYQAREDWQAGTLSKVIL